MTKTMKKIMAWSLAFVCAATAGIAAIATNGFGLGDPAAQVEQVDHNKQLSFGGFFGNGITLTASAEETAVSEDAVRLTATITPASASIQTVDWSVAWVNASSTWASGKNVTDYVSITPTEEGALTADVQCLQAFGEQVQVTVTSRDKPDIKANCTVDYAKRIEKITFSLTDGGSDLHTTDEESITLNCDFSTELAVFSAYTTFEYSVGTVEDEFTVKGFLYGTLTDEMLTTISNEAGYTYTKDSMYPDPVNGHNLTTATKVSYMFKGNGYLLSTGGGTGQLALLALQKYVYDHPETTFFNLKLKATGTYSTFEKEMAVYFNTDLLYTAATGVDIDQVSVVL